MRVVLLVALLAACPAPPPPAAPAAAARPDAAPPAAAPSAVTVVLVDAAPVDVEEMDGCAADSDCTLATRSSLGCCAPCAELEAMSNARVEATKQICGFYQGSETCPPSARADSCPPAEDATGLTAVCREKVCRKARLP